MYIIDLPRSQNVNSGQWLSIPIKKVAHSLWRECASLLFSMRGVWKETRYHPHGVILVSEELGNAIPPGYTSNCLVPAVSCLRATKGAIHDADI